MTAARIDHAGEATVRDVITKIDALRKKADVAERMHTWWTIFDDHLAVEWPVTVRRRWRKDMRLHSEYVMNDDEIDAFRSFLVARASKARNEADNLAAALGIGEES